MRLMNRLPASVPTEQSVRELLDQLRGTAPVTPRRQVAAQRDRLVRAVNAWAAGQPADMVQRYLDPWAAEVNAVCCDGSGLLPVIRTGRRLHVALGMRWH